MNRNMIGEAIACYTEAIGMDPQNPLLFSNRSVAYARGMKFPESLADAETVIKIRPGWSKVCALLFSKLPHYQ